MTQGKKTNNIYNYKIYYTIGLALAVALAYMSYSSVATMEQLKTYSMMAIVVQ